MLDAGQWHTPVPVSASKLQLFVVKVDAVRVPHVGPDPAERLHDTPAGACPSRASM